MARMMKSVARRNVQMKPQKFEAYHLEKLCNEFDPGLGPQYYDYLL